MLSDFEQGVVTLPLIVAIKQMPSVGRRAETGEITKEEVRQAVREQGGTLFTRRVARIYYRKAMHMLDTLQASAQKKQQIASLLQRATGTLLTEDERLPSRESMAG